MGTYVIKPRSQAECNQLASIMHSTGRAVSEYWKEPIRVGVAVVCFSSIDVYHTDVNDTGWMVSPVYLQVNQLYDALVGSEITL